ncbi:ATP-dependent RNA helicase DeaD [Steroidobacter denitrificans]|uniref:ATP-dependent RNA helicase DeaD n=1 Tax=Steroidobacter denitrificans TaxID=465721 RepID=A0A127FCQ2_STEDE|nr:ATP-dependent RNA helicase DeaD [Steroidobacter denitrificans]
MPPEGTRFRDLLANEALLTALDAVGYESPSPIQAATIPPLLAGADVLGQAQTGTGKTAAFALPILSRIELARRAPQALVLVPTRELAIQVAEAFQRYAAGMSAFHVAPIYGGQSYTPQLQTLRRGVHTVVGTPGRIMDHIERGTLALETLKYFVLDEADEMLRMGFIDDVEWILERAPRCQTALFSATMPAAVRRIAQKYLREPVEVTIKSKTTTAAKIRQRYWIVSGVHKLDALTRILEAEPFDGMLVFARTKLATEDLTQRLAARGFAVEALNGDIAQAQRERTITRLKAGQIDIVVATDVAARGLDVERISHVVNYDVPYDPESYVHRIGRTGRAGRSGEAILFIAPRERNMLRVIERATRQSIAPMQLPSIEDVNRRRVERFNERLTQILASGAGNAMRNVVERYQQEHDVPMVEIAAALASIVQGTKSLMESSDSVEAGPVEAGSREVHTPPAGEFEHRPALRGEARAAVSRSRLESVSDGPTRRPERPSGKGAGRVSPTEVETYRIEVGQVHGVKPANIVGAIANEAGLDGRHIGRVVICEDHSFVDLPPGMPKEVFRELQKTRIAGQKLQISRALKTQVQKMRRERPSESARGKSARGGPAKRESTRPPRR